MTEDLQVGPLKDKRPLAVQVYDQLYDVFRDSERDGLSLPTETHLATQLGVSRTTVRQALGLLEEDGLLTRGRQRRRFVRHRRMTPERNAPLELRIAPPGDVTVVPQHRFTEPATAWAADRLQAPRGTTLVSWESSLLIDDQPVANALELTPVGVADDCPDDYPGTLLAALGEPFRQEAVETFARIAPYAATTRAGLGDVSSGNTSITYTHVLSRNGRPVYLAKHVIVLSLAPLVLIGESIG